MEGRLTGKFRVVRRYFGEDRDLCSCFWHVASASTDRSDGQPQLHGARRERQKNPRGRGHYADYFQNDVPGLSSALPVACSARTVVPLAMRAWIRDILWCWLDRTKAECRCVSSSSSSLSSLSLIRGRESSNGGWDNWVAARANVLLHVILKLKAWNGAPDFVVSHLSSFILSLPTFPPSLSLPPSLLSTFRIPCLTCRIEKGWKNEYLTESHLFDRGETQEGSQRQDMKD